MIDTDWSIVTVADKPENLTYLTFVNSLSTIPDFERFYTCGNLLLESKNGNVSSIAGLTTLLITLVA